MVLLSLICCFVFILGSLVLELYYQDLLEELYVKLFDYKTTTCCDAIEEFENNLLIFQVGYAMTTYNKTTGQPVIGFDMGGMSTLGSTCNLWPLPTESFLIVNFIVITHLYYRYLD